MELSTKFIWTSVLKYDEEFRHIQAVYNYPWSFDFHHLSSMHSVVLEPLSTFSGNRSVTSRSSQNTTMTFANVTTEGKVIRRNFNRARGCTLFECNFAHVCNRKIEGRHAGKVTLPTVTKRTKAPLQGGEVQRGSNDNKFPHS